MNIKLNQAALNLIKQSEKILCITHHKAREEDFMTVLALQVFLTRIGKKPFSVVPRDQNFSRLDFLVGKNALKKEIPNSDEYEISIKGTGVEIKNSLEPNSDSENLSIILHKNSGIIRPEDIFFTKKSPEFDLIITLNVSDLDEIGSCFEQNPKLFSETPILNISTDPENNFFGKINLVHFEQSSSMEVLYNLLQEYPESEKYFDLDLSTIFLSGIIRSSHSFLEPSTSPQTLALASHIHQSGVDHSLVIENLFKKHSLSTLKLWGEILENLQFDPVQKIAWSSLDLADFSEKEKISDDLGNISEILLRFVTGSDLSILIIKNPEAITTQIRTDNPSIDLIDLAQYCEGQVKKYGIDISTVSQNLAKTKALMLQKIAIYQKKRLGLNPDLELQSQSLYKENEVDMATAPFPLHHKSKVSISQPKIPETEPFIAPLQPNEKTGKIG